MRNAVCKRRVRRVARLGSIIWLSILCLAVGSPPCAQASHGVAAANIWVAQLDTGNTTNSIRVSLPLALNSFQVTGDSNPADLNVRIGDSATDDEQQGVLISSVAENGRNNFGTNNYPISAVHARGSYRICTFVPTAQTAGSAAEYNVNVSAAWFPYSGFVGGVARNSSGANNATNDLLIGSPGLALGTHLSWVSNGVFLLDLTSQGIDSRTDGVLLVNHAKDENNFALSRPNADGTWHLFVRDNAQPTFSTYEQDPLAFVFIPKTNNALISGRFNGDGSIAMFSGSSPRFTVTNIGTGRWSLRVPGFVPEDGVLIISAEGGGRLNGDNIVSYATNSAGDGWEIESRDTPGNGLQTPSGVNGEPEAVASFVFIPAARAALLKPEGESVGATPRLELAVSNVIGGAVTVTIYGREVPTPPTGKDFMIVALPDTQYYSAERNGGKKEMFIAQAEWVVTNRQDNIAYVAHLGDISDSGDIKSGLPNTTEWRNATNAMYRLENPIRTQMLEGMPFGLAVGNHDQEPNGDPTGTSIYYNQYFGVSRFLGRSYYGGHYGSNNNNHYDLFSVSGLDFLVLYFEYDTGANAAVLAWANSVLAANPNRRIIAVTHYMGTAKTPSSLSAQGAAIYNALKGNKNLFLMLGGHVSGEGSRQDVYNGNTVRTLISDYQSYPNGGNGFMRLMCFSPSNNVVTVQTYSPWTGQYETDADSEFFFPYDMQPSGGSASTGTPWIAMMTNHSTLPGALLGFTWADLKTGQTYEWYATVEDEAGNVVASGPRQFTTGPNAAPFSSNVLVHVTGDRPSQLQLVARDPNGDALTFWTNSLPANGINRDFDTNSGLLTYVPVRGFRGSDRFTFHASDGLASSSVASFNLLVDAPPDTNSNGLPDDWESMYGVSDPDEDSDHDGKSNREEYFANTNPTNAASVLTIISVVRQQEGSVALTWAAVGGNRYRVIYFDLSTGGFSGIYTELARTLVDEMSSAPWGMASTMSCIDTSAATNSSGRFYQIKVVP